jgi:hypothetical protein
MNNATPVVTASTMSERCTLTCPWCGTVSTIRFLGVHALPSCGHVVHVRPRAPVLSRHRRQATRRPRHRGTPVMTDPALALQHNTHPHVEGGGGEGSGHTPVKD